jgi:hypothetical protein
LAAATQRLVKDKNIRTLLEVRKDDENRRLGRSGKRLCKIARRCEVAVESASSDRE